MHLYKLSAESFVEVIINIADLVPEILVTIIRKPANSLKV